MTEMSPMGLTWQASRVPSGAPTRLRTSISRALGGLSWSAPPRTRILQVEHLPRPPQTEACGILPRLLASSTVEPGGARIILWPG